MAGMRLQRNPLFIKSIFLKFTLAFIAVGLIPLLCFSYIVIGAFSRHIEQSTMDDSRQLLGFAGQSLEKMVADYNTITKLLYSYNAGRNGGLEKLLQTTVNARPGATPSFQSTQLMNDFVRYVLDTDAHIQNVLFIDANLRTYYASKSSKQFDSDYNFNTRDQLQAILAGGKRLKILPPHREAYFVRSRNRVITFARNYYELTDFNHPRILGTLLLDVDLDGFEAVFRRLNLGENSPVAVVDDQGYCIYSNDQRQIGLQLNWFLKKRRLFTGEEAAGIIRDRDAYFIFQQVPLGNWTVIGRLSRKDVFKRVNAVRNSIGLMILACSAALVLLSLAFSKGFAIPVRKLMGQMRRVEKGDLTARVAVRSEDEIGQLAAGFNQMVGELQDYIGKSYLAQIKQKEAELEALKSQIRPHFLYNTLEVIRMCAIDNGATTVGEMIHSLSVQLRYTIGFNREMVALRQEVAMIQNYFRLIKIRYEDKIGLELNLPPELLELGILKLSLQPVVENAVLHGIKPKPGPGKVLISGEIGAETLTISVFDDGVGMSPARLARLNELLASERMGEHTAEGWKQIGLKNVQDRLRLNFGAGYGLTVASQERIGTVVRLVMPIISEVTEDAGQSIAGR
jgi:two-component system sensor histidine kinase YesM